MQLHSSTRRPSHLTTSAHNGCRFGPLPSNLGQDADEAQVCYLVQPQLAGWSFLSAQNCLGYVDFGQIAITIPLVHYTLDTFGYNNIKMIYFEVGRFRGYHRRASFSCTINLSSPRVVHEVHAYLFMLFHNRGST